ncbi:MAG: ParB/RepB/Spo0J family partition protein [Oscillospiraceae bacterium]|nr:ParB/RepB/Spo0J family partition protein [Oscillospiraceae bacterium]
MGFFELRDNTKIVEIKINKITVNPNQPRKVFDTDSIEQLAQSINKNGLLQPVLVRQTSDGYELIAGERRLRAFKHLGRERIPAIIKKADEKQSGVYALLENIQRQNLNFFEEALSYRALMEQQGISQQQLAEQLGKNQSTVANKIRLLKFPPEIMEKILRYGFNERQARALLKAADHPKCEQMIEYIAKNSLNVSQTENYIEMQLAQKDKPKRKVAWLVKDIRIFTNTIQHAVDVMNKAGIAAVSTKNENENSLVYTIVIPKSTAVKQNKPQEKLLG